MYGEFRRVVALPTCTVTCCIYCMSMEKCLGELTLCIHGCLSFFRLFCTENRDHSSLIFFLSYFILEMSPCVAIQSPSLCLFQILWRSQTLLLLFQLPWIPLARQLIGGNNKLTSFKPLTNLSQNWRSPKLPVPSLALTHPLTYAHTYCTCRET